jgi:hypothetical protein
MAQPTSRARSTPADATMISISGLWPSANASRVHCYIAQGLEMIERRAPR